MKSHSAKVAVIGRPNVGKSTLFNRLTKERRSIVDDLPGVTRDKLYAEIVWNNKNITLIDTGGLIYKDDDSQIDFSAEVREKVFSAIKEANFIFFIVDGKSSITSQDEKIASYLRKFKDKKEIFLLVNKVDTEKQLHYIHDFYSLGLGEPHPISALQGSSGLADVLDEISNSIKNPETKEERKLIKVSIVGKPNVGKSSILNCLVGEERAIVSPVAGTTRDTIDTKITINETDFLLVDTAGLRRKSKVSSNIERYATSRTVDAIENSDVVLFLIDSNSTLTEQDQKIAALIKRKLKASIIIANKWDLVEDKDSTTINRHEEQIMSTLHFADYSKLLFTSTIKRKNLPKIWDLISEVYENYQRRVSTGKLNKSVEDIILSTAPPTKKGKTLRIYYVTQTSVKPPEIVFFVNDSELVNEQYQRFLEKELRKVFDFTGSPLKLVFRNKKKSS